MSFIMDRAILSVGTMSLPEDSITAEAATIDRVEGRILALRELLIRYEKKADVSMLPLMLDLALKLLHEPLKKGYVHDLYPLIEEMKDIAVATKLPSHTLWIFTALHLSFYALKENSSYFDVLPKRRDIRSRLFEMNADISWKPCKIMDEVNSRLFVMEKQDLILKYSKKRSDSQLMREYTVGRIATKYLAKSHLMMLSPSGRYGIVSEQVKGRDLVEYFFSHGLSDKELRIFSKRALRALASLHEQGFVHGDVKPQNFFGTPKTCVLGDHDEVVRIGEKEFAGTEAYSSPELYRAYMSRTPLEMRPETDIWSFGVCLYLFVGNSDPYDGKTRIDGEILLSKGHKKCLIPEIKEAMKHSLRIDPKERKSAKELLAIFK